MSKINCPNKALPAWGYMVEKLGELESYKAWLANGETTPSIEEIDMLSATGKKGGLESLENTFLQSTTSYLKQQLKLSSLRISSLKRNMVFKRIKNFNSAFGTSHSLNVKQVGQSDIFTWDLIERWNGFNPFQGKLLQLESDGSVPKSYINERLEALLGKFGITVERMKDVIYNDKTVIALADITNRIIKVTKGLENRSTLPEEAGHFFLELLGHNNPLYNRIVSLAKNSELYRSIKVDYEQAYKDEPNLEEKVQIEAAGQLLGKALINKLEGSNENQSWIQKFLQTVEQIFKIVAKKLGLINQSELSGLIDSFASNIVEGKGDIFDQLSEDNLSFTEKNLKFAQIQINHLERTVNNIKSTLIQKQKIVSKQAFSIENVTSRLLLNDVINDIADLNAKEMLIKFIRFAIEDLKIADTMMTDMTDSNNISITSLEQLYQQVAMYDLLDEFVKIETADAQINELKDIVYSKLNPIRDRVKRRYREDGVKLISEKYAELLKNTPMTKDHLQQALLVSAGDINWLKMMLTSLGDNSDIAAAVVYKIISNKKYEVTELVFRTQKLLFDAMEKYTNKTGISGVRMWDFMFQKDENGKPNGLYIEKEHIINGKSYVPFNAKYLRIKKQLKLDLETAKTLDEKKVAISKISPYVNIIEEELDNINNRDILRAFTIAAGKLEEFKDRSYEKLTADQKELYRAWHRLKTDMDKLLPSNQYVGNTLPQVQEGFIDKLKHSSNTKELLSPDLVVSPTSKALYKLDGSEVKFIPINYVGLLNDPNLIERDLAASLILYAEMAFNNKLMHEIEYDINMIQNLVGQRDVTQMKFGKIVSSFINGQTAIPTIKGETTNLYRQMKEYVEMNLYGEMQKEEVVFVLGTSFDVGKAANMINNYTAFKGLALNGFAAVSNVTLGRLQRMGEAISGQHFNVKDWMSANKIYFADVFKDISDITSNVPTTRMGLFVRNLNLTHGFREGIRPDNNQISKRGIFNKLFKVSNLFFLNTMGEHMLQVTTALAIAKRFKLDDGSTINLYKESKVVNGKLVYPSNVTNSDLIRYKTLVSRVNQSMDGIYNVEDRAIAQRYAIGRMTFLFRRFIVPTFEKRWMNPDGAKFNFKSNKFEEGFYWSFAKFIKKVLVELKASSWQLSSLRDSWNSTEDYRKAGVIKATHEMLSMMALAIVLGLAEGELDDDKKVQFVIYQINRLYIELGALFPLTAPRDFFKIVKSPAAGVNTLQDVFRLLGDLTDPFEEYESGKHAGDTKIYWHSIRMIPILNQYDKFDDIPKQTRNIKVLF